MRSRTTSKSINLILRFGALAAVAAIVTETQIPILLLDRASEALTSSTIQLEWHTLPCLIHMRLMAACEELRYFDHTPGPTGTPISNNLHYQTLTWLKTRPHPANPRSNPNRALAALRVNYPVLFSERILRGLMRFGSSSLIHDSTAGLSLKTREK